MEGTTKSKGRKDNLDKFYTKDFIVDICLSQLNLKEFDCIIEPSAGNGSFSNKIANCVAFDIEPENNNIIKRDWFTINKNEFKDKNNILVIGNPPFGEQNSLSVNFFNHSAKIADTIAFILPKSFKKVSIQNRLDLNFFLVKEIELEENAFLLNNNSYSVPTIFQIWKKSSTPRKKIIMRYTSDLILFTDKEQADIRIPRVGGNAGKATLSLNGAKSSNYFIKNLTNYTNIELVSIINSIIFPSILYTVGPKSLPKGELIYELESFINSL